tara:strand:- start:968 stop:1201 length:234 start_codon:yes stop_codon:yes gene_type:complete
MIFYITNIALDFSFGVLWWVTKNTTLGIYNGIYYIKDNIVNNSIDNNEIIMDYIIMDYKEYNKIENIKKEMETLINI